MVKNAKKHGELFNNTTKFNLVFLAFKKEKNIIQVGVLLFD
jgi:hypothetical protein